MKRFEQNQNRQIDLLLARSQSSAETRSRSLGSVALYDTPSSSPILVPQKRRSQCSPRARLSINPELSLDLPSPHSVHPFCSSQSDGGIGPYTDTPASASKRFRENDSRVTPRPITPPVHPDQDNPFPIIPASTMNGSSPPRCSFAHPLFPGPVDMEIPAQRLPGTARHGLVIPIDSPLEKSISSANTKPMSLKERREKLTSHVVSLGLLLLSIQRTHLAILQLRFLRASATFCWTITMTKALTRNYPSAVLRTVETLNINETEPFVRI